LTGAALISAINNNASSTFTVREYKEFEGLSLAELNDFLGMKPDPNIEAAKKKAASKSAAKVTKATATTLPRNFLVSIKWPKCKASFETVLDQSRCGSCKSSSIML
jgi:hypothetical protein